jgi:hypothetical protein
VSARRHAYRDGRHGRSIRTSSGVSGITIAALLQCSRCPKVGDLNCRSMMPVDQMDQKFRQAGWTLDPHVCPDCIRQSKEKRTAAMASNASPAAMKAQAAMFQHLTAHFDPDAGRYAKGWSDKVIADKTGLSVEHVAAFRVAAFGELKDSPEIVSLRAEIAALENLVTEQVAHLRGEIARIAKAA